MKIYSGTREDRLQKKFGAAYQKLNKKEKAERNGVCTQYWNNDVPLISCPPGWEDHQQAQQLIRKYLTSEDVIYKIENCLLIVKISEEEWNLIAKKNLDNQPHRAEFSGLYISVTFYGCCLVRYNNRPPSENDIKCYSYEQYAEMSGNNPFIKKAVLYITPGCSAKPIREGEWVGLSLS